MRLSPLSLALTLSVSATLTACSSGADTSGTASSHARSAQVTITPHTKTSSSVIAKSRVPVLTELSPVATIPIDPHPLLKYVELRPIAGLEAEEQLIVNDAPGIIHGQVYDDYNLQSANFRPQLTPRFFQLTPAIAQQNHVSSDFVMQQQRDASIYQQSFVINRRQQASYTHKANVNIHRLLGLAPVFIGQGIVTSRGNHGSFDTQPAGISHGDQSFTGKGVTVAMLDGEWHPDVYPYLGKDVQEYQFKPVETDHSISELDHRHAIKVANIIAGKRTAGLTGIAPEVSLRHVSIASGEQDYGKLYQQLYAQYRPAIINLSLRLNNPQPNNILYAARYTGEYLVNMHHSFLSTYGAISYFQQAHPDDGPLFVFASGNYDYKDWLQQQVLSGKLTDANVALTNFQTYGLKIDEHEAIAQFANAPDVNNLLVVTGVAIDYGNHEHSTNLKNQALTYLYQQQDAKNLVQYQQSYTKYQQAFAQYQQQDSNYRREQQAQADKIIAYQKEHPNTSDAEAAKALELPILQQPIAPIAPTRPISIPKPRILHALDDIEASHYQDDYRITPESFVSYPGARQCGVTMYSCLAASDIYNFQEKGGSPYWSISSGTSYATPQVSAIAALVKQQFDFMSASNLKATLLTTAYDIGAPGVDPVYGWGLVNDYRALRGPAMFAFGDFIVNLGNRAKNYYFTNDISGTGGLIVNGGSNSYLYLTGNNHYTGLTQVLSGNLALVSADVLGISRVADIGSDHRVATLDGSDTVVQHAGNLYVTNGRLRNLFNNGYTQLSNAHITGDVTNSGSGTLGFDITGKSVIDGRLLASGNVYLYASKGNAVYDDIRAVAGNELQPTKGVVFIEAKQGVIGKFRRSAISVPALFNYQLYYGQYQIAATLLPKSLTVAARDVAGQGYNQDAQAMHQAAARVEGLVAGTQPSSVITTNTSTTTSSNLMQPTSVPTETRSESPTTNPSSQPSKTTTNAPHRPQVATAEMLLNPNYGRTDAVGATESVLLTANDAMNISSSTPASELMSQLQGLSAPQYQQFLLHTAATPYADSQLAATTKVHALQQQLGQRLTGRFATTDRQVHGYVSLDHSNTRWKRGDTTIKGHQASNGFSLGAYTQRNHINYGIGLLQQQLDWQETLDTSQAQSQFSAVDLQATTALNGHLVADAQLGDSNIKVTSLLYSQSVAYQQWYAGATAIASQYQYRTTRSDVLATESSYKQASFKASEYSVALQAGYQLCSHAHHTLGLHGTLVGNSYQQQAFSEELYQSSTASALLQIHARAKSQVTWAATLGLDYQYQSSLWEMPSKFIAGFAVTSNLSRNDYSLVLESQPAVATHTAMTTAQAFNQAWLSQLQLGYNLQLTPALQFQIAAQLQSSTNYHTGQVKLALDYSF